MQITVVVNKKHNLRVELEDGQPIGVTARSINLSEHDIFRHPFEPRAKAPFHHTSNPLREHPEQAFRSLNLAEDSSPLVHALRRYYEQRFPDVVDSIKCTTSYDEGAVLQRLALLRQDTALSQKTLSSIVTRIEHAVPSFFAIEKMLGTYSGLCAGAADDLPLKFVSNQESLRMARFKLVNPGRTESLFDISEQRCFMPTHISSDPASIVEALCRGGRTGDYVRLINRASAIQMMTDSMTRDIEHARSVLRDFDESTEAPPVHLGILKTLRSGLLATSLLLGSLGAAGAAGGLAGTPQNSLLLSLAFTTGSTGAACHLLHHFCTLRGERVSRREVEAARRFLQDGFMVPQSVLSSVILRFLDDRSSAREHPATNTEQDSLWRPEFEGMSHPDLRAVPQETESSECGGSETRYYMSDPLLQIEPSDDYSFFGQDVVNRIRRELYPEFVCLNHIETADRHWHLLKAIDVTRSFSAWAGLPQAVEQSFFEDILYDSLNLRCDYRGHFPPIQKAFERMLHLLKLDLETWSFCARPLFSYDLLERADARRRAQEIALCELLG